MPTPVGGVRGDLGEVRVGKSKGWLLSADMGALESPPVAEGIRLLPPGDPYLQKPNRLLLAPDPSCESGCSGPWRAPGRVLRDGRLTGLWRVKAKGRERPNSPSRSSAASRARDLEQEAQRVAELRGAAEGRLSFSPDSSSQPSETASDLMVGERSPLDSRPWSCSGST